MDFNSIAMARALLRSSTEFSDLTSSQYAEALDWLLEIGAVEISETATGKLAVLPPFSDEMSESEAAERILTEVLHRDPPPYLVDIDDLIVEPNDLPIDLLDVADALSLEPERALLAVQLAGAKVDTEMRAVVGAAGEAVVVQLLRDLRSDGKLPTRTQVDWVSQRNDAAGYDICVSTPDNTWLLEVKTTTRAGTFRLYISRNEFEVGRRRSGDWWLVAVQLTDDFANLLTLGHSGFDMLQPLAPRDTSSQSRWQQLRIDLASKSIRPGLPIPVAPDKKSSVAHTGVAPSVARPAWFGE
jgi:hypothetical protein